MTSRAGSTRVVRLVAVGLLAAVLIVAALGAAPTRARADGNSYSSPTITAWGYYLVKIPGGWLPVPVFVNWSTNMGGSWTNYGPYYHLDSWSHFAGTTQDYSGYDGHVQSTTQTLIYNGSGILRYVFYSWFGFGCFHPTPWTTYNCGSQPTDLWINPSPLQVKLNASMGFVGQGWGNSGGNGHSPPFFFW